MPPIKPSPLEQSRRIVRACISNNMELYALDEDRAARRIQRCKRNFQDKYKEPEGFTLGELWNLQKDLKFTPIQAASIMLGRSLTSREIKEFIIM